MVELKNTRYYSGIILALILVFSFQLLNKAVYTHSHILKDGTVITHAHPYDKESDSGPFKSHHHNPLTFYFLQQLDILFPLLVVALLSIYPKVIISYLQIKISLYFTSYRLSIPGRSPPVI